MLFQVKKAFFALVANGVRAAPLWESKKQSFVGKTLFMYTCVGPWMWMCVKVCLCIHECELMMMVSGVFNYTQNDFILFDFRSLFQGREANVVIINCSISKVFMIIVFVLIVQQ